MVGSTWHKRPQAHQSDPLLQYLADRASRLAPIASGQACGKENLPGASWLALPPFPRFPQPLPSMQGDAPRSCGPGPEKRCISPWQPITMQQGLPGYGLGCADVSTEGASKPARWNLAEQSRPARGRPAG